MTTMEERLAQMSALPVTVNQRALIEKILARYSGEYTLYREALQNADDAGASCVEIWLGGTGEGTVDLERPMMDVEIRNDGAAFTSLDWKRLTTIAEGNPDESKIGNFGVGFYSNFALSDNPAVQSGDSFMQFFFEGDQLFIKVLHDLAPETDTSAGSSSTSTPSSSTESKSLSSRGNPWTSIILKLREPTPVPDQEPFSRFLATSLGFTSNLRIISVFINGHVVTRLSKTVAPPKSLSLSVAGLPAVSPRKHLRIDSLEDTPVQIRAEVAAIIGFRKKSVLPTISTPAAASTSFAARMLSGFLSSKSSTPPPPALTPTPPPILDDPLALRTTTLFLRTIQATLKVTPTPHLASELLRATKKPLPQATRVSIIFTSKDEADASEPDAEEGVRRIFAGLRSDGRKNGRIFIGFSTHQSTGFSGAIAASFVPTVERESIDLQSTYVAEWNRELLWAAGIVGRHIYELEMSDIVRLWKSNGDDYRRKLEDRFLHLFRFFTFSASTPSSVVGQDIQRAFFTTSTKGIHILSSTGVLPSTSARLSSPQLAAFYRGAVVPASIVEGASSMIAEMKERRLIVDVALEDVLADLSNHTLCVEEAVACFQWWIGLASIRSYNRGLLSRLQNAAILTIDDGFAPLSSFQTFVNPKLIPLDLPFPPHTLPYAISRAIVPNSSLESVFELRPLSLPAWIQFLVSAKIIGAGTDATAEVLEKILSTTARGWSGLSARDQEIITTSLRIPCIPTSKGIQLPSESYFANVVIFDDLPIISLRSNGKGMDQFLQSLGVRRSVELQLVFSRMLGTGNWSTVDLVTYLASVEKTLQSNELDRLRKTNFLSQESQAGATIVRCRPDQLYEPTSTLRALGGLPILAWTGKQWRSTSDEAKFLFKLGLLRSPPVDTLLKLASTAETHRNGLDYFLAEYQNAGYHSSYNPSIHSYAFVPAIKNSKSILGTPQEVFSEAGPDLLSLATLDPRCKSDAAKFKIMAHPPPSTLVSALLSAPPKDAVVANSIFAYLSTQLSKFSNADLQRLRAEKIIPIRSSTAFTLTRANACFFALDSSIPSGLQSLFTTLPIEFDFASKPFLVAIGVRESPSIVDVAEMLVEDPDRMYGLAGTTEKYLQLLRSIAVNYERMSPSIKSRMRATPWFLGSRRISPVKSSSLLDGSDDEEESSLSQFQLTEPSDVLVVDDPNAAMIFADSILACPQEDALEKLAESLGAQRISRLIAERYSVKGEPSESKRTVELRRVVEERTQLFLAERQASSARSDLIHSSDWIKTHLTVREVHSLERVISLTSGGTTKRHSATTSASAQLDSKGAILLYIASSQELDYFELALGLCRMLLKKQRTHDPLLLMTILSTSLKNLKRRGFNVDRILNIRKAEQILVEQKHREQQVQEQLDLANSLSSDKLSQHLAKLEMMFPDAAPDHLISLLQSEKKDHLERATETLLAGNYPRRPIRSGRNQSSSNTTTTASPPSPPSSSNTGSVFSSFKRKLLSNPSSPSRPLPEPNSASTSALRPPVIPTTSQLGPPPSTLAGTPSSTADVRSNILKAVQASRPSSNTVQNTLSKTQIKEAEGTYCDSSASADLKFLAELDGIRFFIDAGVQDRDYFLAKNSEAIMRMIGRVVKPVAGVFRLNPNTIHIFFDETGPLIAFNRNGSLFLNFRYYTSLHDDSVRANSLSEPLISCFHTLAHELAHNLVGPHNSEFSYYFSAICEEHFVRMSALLARFQSSSSL